MPRGINWPLVYQQVGDALLTNLHHRHCHRAGKVADVVTLERGQSHTAMQMDGRGALTHLWSTWLDVPPPIFEFYVDGETTPSIAGPFDNLCRSSLYLDAFFPFHPSLVIPTPERPWLVSWNLYSPIYFERSIRIEMRPSGENCLLFYQIDYRLEGEGPARPRMTSGLAGHPLHYEPEPARFEAQPIETRSEQFSLSTDSNAAGQVAGPGVVRSLALEYPAGSNELPPADVDLEIFADDLSTPLLKAPLRYLFSRFASVAVESKLVEPGRIRSELRFPMPFKRKMNFRLTGAPCRAEVCVATQAIDKFDQDMLYFRGRFTDTPATRHLPVTYLQTASGPGHFVGFHSFDSGHNHGGGDTAIVDGLTGAPTVITGINGEDYFGYAWHASTDNYPLVGGPYDEGWGRWDRYRIHLENVYPFDKSLAFVFGHFKGEQPKGVAFWYEAHPDRTDDAESTKWRVLGPLPLKTLDEADYTTGRLFQTQTLTFPADCKLTGKDCNLNIESIHAIDVPELHHVLDLTYAYRAHLDASRLTDARDAAPEAALQWSVEEFGFPDQRRGNDHIGAAGVDLGYSAAGHLHAAGMRI